MMIKTGHLFCFFDIKIGGELASRQIIVELFSDAASCPKTCMNFLDLCNADEGIGYKGTKFHRVVKNGWVQGGDVQGASQYIPDENFMITFGSCAGMLGLANEGDVHTNQTQFFFTLKPLPSFDGKYVALGRIVSGFDTVLSIASSDTVNEVPVLDCTVADCGTFIVLDHWY
jgi:peptidyl-prolyl cis-trans isomerase-like 6